MTIEELIRNKAAIMAQKKAAIKHGDVVMVTGDYVSSTVKADSSTTKDTIKVKLVINTTNLMDSHSDVHIKGIWNKSVKELKYPLLLQEHKLSFDKIIADGEDIKVSVEPMKWNELGQPYKGDTEALIFDATLKVNRNPFMVNQYQQGYVKNHSVGMQYVKLFLAVNDDRYKEEFAVWNQYIDQVANKEVAEERGYFWAVTEAKIIEGSAVPIGSNTATPTLEVKEAALGTSTLNNEPQSGTQSTKSNINLLNLI